MELLRYLRVSAHHQVVDEFFYALYALEDVVTLNRRTGYFAEHLAQSAVFEVQLLRYIRREVRGSLSAG